MKTFPVGLARNNAESDRCAILAIDHDVGERRNTNDIDANRRKEAARDRDRFHGLIDRPCTNRLDLYGNTIFDHASYSTCNRCRR